jgi:GxxExxY protein
MNVNEITGSIVDASLKIHRQLGPGLLESVYEVLLEHELKQRGIAVERQKEVPIVYEGMKLPEPFRVDLLVGGQVIVELKSVEALQPVHYRQILTYLRLAKLRVGLLINFNVPVIKDGIHRLVDGTEP